MSREVGISFEQNEIYECGAQLLTILAYPAPDEKELRLANIYTSLCAKALWDRFIMNPNDTTPIRVKPQYVFRDTKVIDRDVKAVGRKLEDRLEAGRVANAFMVAAETGASPSLPGVARLSLNEMAAFVAGDAGQSDATNVKSRVWRPSQPVILLSAAAALVGQEYLKKGMGLRLEQFLVSRDLTEEVIRRAELLEPLAICLRKVGVKAETLVRVRLV